MPRRPILQNLRRRIGRAVIHNDKFEVLKLLREDAADRFVDVRLAVVDRHEHRQLGISRAFGIHLQTISCGRSIFSQYFVRQRATPSIYESWRETKPVAELDGPPTS